MKFICFCYYDPKIANALSPQELEALSAAGQPHYEAWEKTGKVVTLSGLSDPEAWRTIVPTDTSDNADSAPRIARGPFLSDSERMGAFFIVEAKDMDEATEIAAKHPGAHTGRFLGGGIEICVCESFQTQAPAA